MNKITNVLIVLVGLLCLSIEPAAAQESRFPNFEQEQAATIASQIAQQKSLAKDNGVSGKVLDTPELLNRGYEAWDNLEFDKAKSFFERAMALDPGNEEISRIIFEVDKAKLQHEHRQVEMKKEVLQEQRILDTEKAWLVDQPGAAAIAGEPVPVGSRKLRDIAEKKHVSVDFNDAQLNKIIEYLSDVSGINIIMDESAVSRAGTLSIHMKDISLVQALESVLRTKGLAYRFEENNIWISTRDAITNEEMVTRVYHLSQGLATFTTFTTFDTVTVKNLKADYATASGDSESAKDAKACEKESASKAKGEKEDGIATYEGVKIGGPGGVAGKITMTIKDVLKEIVTWPEGSSIFLDNRTSTLIVRNTPSNLSVLEQALEALDVNPPQVMIEARFVEIGTDDLFSLGLKVNSEITATGSQRGHTFPFNKNSNDNYTNQMNNVQLYETSAGAIVSEELPFDFTLGTLDFTQFQAVLSAIETDTNSNTLSSPKVTTISGQEAVVKIVKEYRYPTKYEIQTYDSVVGDQTRTYYATVPSEFKTRDIGIILKVTPNVGADGKTINLTLVPEVSEFDIDNDMYDFGSAGHPYKQPFFEVRNATASIVVNNNDTVVMGGLMREVVEHSVSRVPILGKIPLLGALFTHKSDNKQKRNLLIFITAHIIKPTGETVQSSN